MMAENPNWCSLNGSSSTADDPPRNHVYPVPWTQLLVRRLETDQEKGFNNSSNDSNPDFRRKQLDQKSSNNSQITSYGCHYSNSFSFNIDHHGEQGMKEESIYQQQQQLYSTQDAMNHKYHDHPWPSSFTDNHINYLDFSRDRKRSQDEVLDQNTSLQCNDTSMASGTSKKARVQPSSTQQPALKVRKEKLGDRITALHQLVSPFGKTDTASVLLEAMGYIRFLEGQVQALSSAYSGNASTRSTRIQQSVNDQLASGKDLRSRGLSLVPVDYAHHINNTIGINNNSINNGADYWASSSI
ncbi:hypothetical protein AgCh_031602 [Apium graveolens]